MSTISTARSFRFRYLLYLFTVGVAVAVHARNTAVPVRSTDINTNSEPPAAAVPDPVSDVAAIDIAAIERDRILRLAAEALATEPVTITKYRAKFSQGGPNDFYSNGDYWWPNPKGPTGLPYVRRDGETNPGNFFDHRRCLVQLRDNVSALAAAYKITGNNRYATTAAEWLKVFFLDASTRMNPNLHYAQAIPGVSAGRSIGIIDSLPLVEVPKAIEAVQRSPQFPPAVADGVKEWFADYLNWMVTSTNGQDTAELPDDHAVMYWLQVAVYATYVGDEDELNSCHNRFKYYFLSNQMAPDGSFPKEFARSNPYGYSICQLDNLALMCHVLSDTNDNLWNFTLPDKGGIRRAVDYMYPYLEDKSKWPKKAEGNWPTRQANLLFAALAYNDPRYMALWRKLEPDPSDEEVRRNLCVTQPVLWLK